MYTYHTQCACMGRYRDSVSVKMSNAFDREKTTRRIVPNISLFLDVWFCVDSWFPLFHVVKNLMHFVQDLLSWNTPLPLALAALVIRALLSLTLQLESVCRWGQASLLSSSPKSRPEFCVSIAPLSLFFRKQSPTLKGTLISSLP